MDTDNLTVPFFHKPRRLGIRHTAAKRFLFQHTLIGVLVGACVTNLVSTFKSLYADPCSTKELLYLWSGYLFFAGVIFSNMTTAETIPFPAEMAGFKLHAAFALYALGHASSVPIAVLIVSYLDIWDGTTLQKRWTTLRRAADAAEDPANRFEALLVREITQYNELAAGVGRLIQTGELGRDHRDTGGFSRIEVALSAVRKELALLTEVWTHFPRCRQSLARLKGLMEDAEVAIDEAEEWPSAFDEWFTDSEEPDQIPEEVCATA